MTFVSTEGHLDHFEGAFGDSAGSPEAAADDDERGAPEPAEDPGNGDEAGKPTIDEPTAPALDPTPDEFDKQAEEA